MIFHSDGHETKRESAAGMPTARETVYQGMPVSPLGLFKVAAGKGYSESGWQLSVIEGLQAE